MSANKETTDDLVNVDSSRHSHPSQMQRTPTAIRPDAARKRSFSETYPEHADTNSSTSPRKRSRTLDSPLRYEETAFAPCDLPQPPPTDKLVSSPNVSIQHLSPKPPDLLECSSHKVAIPFLLRPLSTRLHKAPGQVEPFTMPAPPHPIALPKFPCLVAGLNAPSNDVEVYERVLKEKDEHAAELQMRLDDALHENRKLRKFMEELGMRLIKGPHRPQH